MTAHSLLLERTESAITGSSQRQRPKTSRVSESKRYLIADYLREDPGRASGDGNFVLTEFEIHGSAVQKKEDWKRRQTVDIRPER